MTNHTSIISAYLEGLSAISDGQADIPLSKGKWNRKEILGHLIDSAQNNRRRFIKAATRDNLIFDGYDQDNWVNQQGYREMSWDFLVQLWLQENELIVHLINRLPKEKLDKVCSEHNFHQIAFRSVKADSQVTLRFLIEDYYLHMRHHIHQILQNPD